MSEHSNKGFAVAVITYDSTAILADFSRRRGITFPLLSDQGSATIKSYGLLNSTVDSASTNYGIPFPGTFVFSSSCLIAPWLAWRPSRALPYERRWRIHGWCCSRRHAA